MEEFARGNFKVRRLLSDVGVEPPARLRMIRSPFRRLLRPAVLALAATAGLGVGAGAAAPADAAAAPAPRIVVRFAPGTTAAQRARVTHAAGTTTPRHVIGTSWTVATRGTTGARAMIARLQRRRDVVSATPEYRARAAAFTPNDTGVAQPGGTAGGWAAQQPQRGAAVPLAGGPGDD